MLGDPFQQPTELRAVGMKGGETQYGRLLLHSFFVMSPFGDSIGQITRQNGKHALLREHRRKRSQSTASYSPTHPLTQ